MNRFFIILLFLPQLIWSQELKSTNVWEPFEYFIGDWEGKSFGEAGEGAGQRTYQFVMDFSFLYHRNSITFEPAEKNMTEKIHEDIVFFNYDKSRELITAHRFCIEGIYCKFVLDSMYNDKRNFIFTSEYSENGLPGSKMRLSYKIIDQDKFIETLESGLPGKDFYPIMTTNWQRKTE